MLNQIIITGTPVPPDVAQRVRMWCTANLFFVDSTWLHPDGGIGYIDSVNRKQSHDQYLVQLKNLAVEFPIFDLGVSYMSGPPKSYNMPEVSWSVRDGKVKPDIAVHVGHPAPKRWKP